MTHSLIEHLSDLPPEAITQMFAGGEISAQDYHAFILQQRNAVQEEEAPAMPMPHTKADIVAGFQDIDEPLIDNLEDTEIALAEIAHLRAANVIKIQALRQIESHLYARYILIEQAVKSARRRKERGLFITLGDGSKLTLEEVA